MSVSRFEKAIWVVFIFLKIHTCEAVWDTSSMLLMLQQQSSKSSAKTILVFSAYPSAV